VGLGALAAALLAVSGYYYVSFSRLIDARLHGERERTLPRVYARPVEVRRGQSITETEFIARLNDLGYTHRARVEGPGEFAIGRNAIAITPRDGDLRGKVVRVEFNPPAAVKRASATAPVPTGIRALEVVGRGRADALRLDTPLLTALMTGGREKRRRVPLASIPKRMQQAVIAIEDQRFYSHPGVNPVTTIGAVLTNVFGDKPYAVGGSTITQQLARNFFLSDEMAVEQATRRRSVRRKVLEWFMSLILERKATKDEILELYLNEVYLGQRGSFAIHGVAEAARLFFAKDVSNLSVSEAALIAGVIQSPGTHSPFARPERAVERRNVVLRAMAEEEYISADAAERASREPLQVVARAVDNEAPYFVDLVGQRLAEDFPGATAQPGAVDVFTTLDINLQRIALDAVRTGLTNVDHLLSRRRRRPPQPAQAALIAIHPRTGEVLAMVGGRSYNQSQYNRAYVARRQPGSTFKPFVYLAAFERAAEESRADLTPAALTIDEPQTFTFDQQVWEPGNYEQEYDGEITWRRALALSRNLGTIHVGEAAGFDRVAALWRKVGVGTPPQGYPSIVLGVFELTPFEVAQAYTLFTNAGAVQPLRAIDRVRTAAREIVADVPEPRPVARPETTYLVTNMMRSVINEGTGAGARGSGFTLDAAGKSGTTNDLRDAWFVGFTPELLTVVWVGFDDNTPLGLSGTQAALPIWTEFMKHALAGHPSIPFEPPDGISFVDIDRDTGKLAQPGCPRIYTEAFLAGTEPLEVCELHSWR
jgi:penicillin-binding protein 1B